MILQVVHPTIFHRRHLEAKGGIVIFDNEGFFSGSSYDEYGKAWDPLTMSNACGVMCPKMLATQQPSTKTL